LPSPGCQEHALFDMQYAFKESEIRMDYRDGTFLITCLQQEWVQNRNLNQKREQKMSKFFLVGEYSDGFSKDIIAHRFYKAYYILVF